MAFWTDPTCRSRASRRAGHVVTLTTAAGLLVLGGLIVSAGGRYGGEPAPVVPETLLTRPSLLPAPGPGPGPAGAGPGGEGRSGVQTLPDEIRWFDGRPIRPARVLQMRVTAYSPDARSCAPFDDGITASGYSVWTNGMKLVAADTELLPFGSLVSVPGYDGGAVVPVLDRGARIKGHRLDVLLPAHHHARRWGVRDLAVTVWEYADGRPAGFVSGW